MTQEFHISVTPVGSDEYLVRTERVAPGVPLAEEQVVWEVDQWLIYTQQLMNNPLSELLQGNGTRVGGFEFYPPNPSSGNGHSTPPTLLELGQVLYNKLFYGTLRDSWMTARGIAQHKGEMLRLRLGLKGSTLPRLPWEVLNAGEKDGLNTLRRPVATGTDIVFSRYQPGIGMMGGYLPPLEPGQPVRVLMAIAAPTDQERLELRREALNLQQELRQPRTGTSDTQAPAPEFEVTVLEQPGREQLTQALEQGQFHVLHYAGHSNLGISGGNLYLVNERTGLTEVLSGDDLAGLLVNNGIRMVVFNSCRGSHSAQGAIAGQGALSERESSDRNLAESLVGRGIPAVLAMAERIPDDVALNLTRLFYRNLKQGYPLDLSLSRARQGLISSYGSHQFYWALPVLYLHPEWDGYLVSGDRTRLNPADRLLLMPQVYDTPPKLAGEDTTLPLSDTALSDPDDELEMISRAVLDDSSEDSGDQPGDQPGKNGRGAIAPGFDAPLPLSADFDPLDELSYENGSPSMAELLQQLTPDETDAMLLPDGDEPDWRGTATAQATPTSPIPASLLPQSGPATPASAVSAEADGSSDAPVDTVPSKGRAQQKAAMMAAPKIPKVRAAYLILPLVGAAAMAVVLGVSHLSQRSPTPDDLLPNAALGTNPLPPSTLGSIDLATADAETVTAVAILRFNQNDLAAGEIAVTELLNRNDLQSAEAALRNLQPDQVTEPEILFLKGRLVWHQLRQGNPDYAFDDARRYWNTAATDRPGSATYRTALGFAFYAENQLPEAIQAWCQAITLIQKPGTEIGAGVEPECAMPDAPIGDRAALNAYAGIALALRKAEADPTRPDLDRIQGKASQLYEQILLSSPDAVDPTQLPEGWLWTTEMIQDWQALGSQGSE